MRWKRCLFIYICVKTANAWRERERQNFVLLIVKIMNKYSERGIVLHICQNIDYPPIWNNRSVLTQTYWPSRAVTLPLSNSGELRTQKSKSHLVRTQSLNVLPLKPGAGQHIAIHATLTARDFFLDYFYLSGPFTCIFSKTSPDFLVLAMANTWFLCRPTE